MAPTVVATTGTPAAIASMIAIGWPSRNEGSTKMSASRSRLADLVAVLGTDQAVGQAGGRELRHDLGVLRFRGRALAADDDQPPVGEAALAQQPGGPGQFERALAPTDHPDEQHGRRHPVRPGRGERDTSIALSTVRTGVRPAKARIVSVPASDTVQTRRARRSVRSASRSSRP